MSRVLMAPEERKAELIQLASKLFFEKGYTDTKVRDIIAAAHGSQGMFYHYFSSKDDIYRAVMEDYIENYLRELRTAFYNDEIPINEKLVFLMSKFRAAFNACRTVMDSSDNTDNVYFLLELKSRIAMGIIEPIQHIIDQLIALNIVKREDILNGDSYTAATYVAYGIHGIVNSRSADPKKSEIGEEEFKSVIYYSLKTLGVEDTSLLYK